METSGPAPSNRARVRTWIQKLGTKDPLAFSGQGINKRGGDIRESNKKEGGALVITFSYFIVIVTLPSFLALSLLPVIIPA